MFQWHKLLSSETCCVFSIEGHALGLISETQTKESSRPSCPRYKKGTVSVGSSRCLSLPKCISVFAYLANRATSNSDDLEGQLFRWH